jgi:Uma2 family endonuclease
VPGGNRETQLGSAGAEHLAVYPESMLDPAALAPERPRRLSRAEYDRLVELGFFDDERIELLHGTLVTMSPNDPGHVDPVAQLGKILFRALEDRAEVRIQFPFIAVDDSEPEPDVAVVPIGDYRAAHPGEALLIVEVAVTSLGKDRRIKGPLYAASGVPEYWIVNVPERCIEVHRAPADGIYTAVSRHGAGEAIAPLGFPDVAIRVDDVLR